MDSNVVVKNKSIKQRHIHIKRYSKWQNMMVADFGCLNGWLAGERTRFAALACKKINTKTKMQSRETNGAQANS